MLIGDTEKIDEGEVTLYILGKDDYTLCPKGYQTVIAIGPTFKEWINPKGDYHTEAYFKQKQERCTMSCRTKHTSNSTKTCYERKGSSRRSKTTARSTYVKTFKD